MKKLFILAFVLSVALNLGVLGMIGWHHYQRCDRIKPKHGFCPFYEKRFGLSKEKAGKMEELRRTLMQEMKPEREDLDRERKGLVSLLSASEVDKKEIEQRLKNIQTLQGRIQSMFVEHILSAKEKLTKEERKKFFGFIMERMGSRKPGPRMEGPAMGKEGGDEYRKRKTGELKDYKKRR